ncbi:MAG: hypothetical protein Fur0015_06890 [Ignavibacteriales bacterium]
MEAKVILFLIAALIVGSLIEYSGTENKFAQNDSELMKLDSAFNSVKNEISEDSAKIQNKKFDNKQELSEFSKEKAAENSKNQIAESRQYNLNTVTLSQLLTLKGIGEKVAENIVSYRNKIGKFESVDQLLEVKGIGEKKLNQLKKFLIIK